MGCSISTCGSNSIPTETKNSTEKASLSGKDSWAARWLRSDSLITIPAKKAPRAKETPKSMADPKAMPIATAMTLKMKSSAELVLATCQRSQGKTRFPTTSIRAMKTNTLPNVSRRVITRLEPETSTVDSPAHRATPKAEAAERAPGPSQGLQPPASRPRLIR